MIVGFQVKDPRQLSLALTVTLRERLLAGLAAGGTLIKGRALCIKLSTPYKPTIDALYALHRDGLIYRAGRKSTARWGSLAMAPKSSFDAGTFQDCMYAIAKR
jgi:hypothetical protein